MGPQGFVDLDIDVYDYYLLWRDIRVQWSLHPAVGACEAMFWCGDMTADIGD